MIVVSKFSRHLGVVHTYGDHVSFDKFVEANWRLGPSPPSAATTCLIPCQAGRIPGFRKTARRSGT